MYSNFKKYNEALSAAHQKALDFIEKLDSAPVSNMRTHDQLAELWEKDLPAEGKDPVEILDLIDKAARPGLLLNQSGRFFSWVIGGSLPAALAADWLTSTWDQNAGLFAVAPSAAVVEEIAGEWLKKLFRLPSDASFAFVTGCQMAHVTCLNAARNHLLSQSGWDVETKGLNGAPPIRIICGDQKHVTINRAVRLLGLGLDSVIQVPTDSHGKIITEEMQREIVKYKDGPCLILLQAGDVNTGIYDDFASIIPFAHQFHSWVHVDGAFGLWAAASNQHRHLVEGVENADSWATDGHKWLNVPYDCGYAFTAHPGAHFNSLALTASYVEHTRDVRNEMDWTPEFSRRARGFATYAAIMELGEKGIEEMINRCCDHAATIISQAADLSNVEVVSPPVINQGLLRFLNPLGGSETDHDAYTELIIRRVNESGEAFFQPTTFKGKRCMRVSVSGWNTTDDDVRRTVAAIGNAVATH